MAMIPVARDTLSTLLICSLRYALGRHSVIVGQVAGIVREHYGRLLPGDRAVAIRDVEEHVAKYDDADYECDRVEWRSLLAWMKTTKETAR